jgi:hypothetical protein
MLGKLIKYEWKSLFRVECVILAVMFAFTIVGAVILNTPAVYTMLEEFDSLAGGMQIIFMFSFVSTAIMYIVVLIGGVYGSFIYQGVHFYKTMYSDEGYLSHTLPVSSHELLGSKVIVNSIWTIIMTLSAILSAVIIVFSFAHALGYDPSYEQLLEDISETVEIITSRNMGVVLHWVFYVFAAVILSPVATICTLFGALTIGQLAKKMRGILGIIIYFAICFVSNLINSLAQIVGTLMLMQAESLADLGFHIEQFFARDIKLIIAVLVGVALYFVSHYIITEKLNLQ